LTVSPIVGVNENARTSPELTACGTDGPVKSDTGALAGSRSVAALRVTLAHDEKVTVAFTDTFVPR
jgi:hypothetical protein